MADTNEALIAKIIEAHEDDIWTHERSGLIAKEILEAILSAAATPTAEPGVLERVEQLEKLTRSNISTMQAQVSRFKFHHKSHDELDTEISESEAALSTPARPQLEAPSIEVLAAQQKADQRLAAYLSGNPDAVVSDLLVSLHNLATASPLPVVPEEVMKTAKAVCGAWLVFDNPKRTLSEVRRSKNYALGSAIELARFIVSLGKEGANNG